MTLEAFPFVNWIFWAALAAGTLLVVGVTEAWGGTTRGYRLFMAGTLAVCGAVLLVSELNLPPGTPADATAELRRWLTIAFVAGIGAYLVANVAKWPRSGLAIGSALVGIAALGALAIAGETRSAPLFGMQLTLSAVVLGSATASMLLGHWYLVTPQLSPVPLRRMIWALGIALALQVGLVAVAIVSVGGDLLGGQLAWLVWLRVSVGLVAPIGISSLALLASRAASLQASTGLLYIGLALVMAGSIAGASLSFLTGVPV